MKARELMETAVVSVSPELPVAELEAFLTAEEIHGAPVVDRDGKLLGVVSQTDVVRALSEESSLDLRELLAPDLIVEQIMTPQVLTVDVDEDVVEVARKMADGHMHRALVVDGDGVQGIITAFDLLRIFGKR